MTVKNDTTVVDARTFWEAKIRKIIQKFEYNRIDEESLRHEMGLMGYSKAVLDVLLSEEETA